MADNLLRAAGSLASLAYARGRGATLRRDLINVAARIARHGRGEITLHLPDGWHREQDGMNLFEDATGRPSAGGPDSPEPVNAPQRPQRPPRRTASQDPRRVSVDKPQKGKRQESHARHIKKIRILYVYVENDRVNRGRNSLGCRWAGGVFVELGGVTVQAARVGGITERSLVGGEGVSCRCGPEAGRGDLALPVGRPCWSR